MIAPMPATELRQTMHLLGCSTQQRLADRIGVHRSTVGWCLLGKPIPKHIALLLRLMVAG